jgi:hypothetical protein
MTMAEMMEDLATRGLVLVRGDPRPHRPSRLVYGPIITTYNSPLPKLVRHESSDAELDSSTSRNK